MFPIRTDVKSWSALYLSYAGDECSRNLYQKLARVSVDLVQVTCTKQNTAPAQKLSSTWHEPCSVIGWRVVLVQETAMNLRHIFRAGKFLVQVKLTWACVAGIVDKSLERCEKTNKLKDDARHRMESICSHRVPSSGRSGAAAADCRWRYWTRTTRRDHPAVSMSTTARHPRPTTERQSSLPSTHQTPSNTVSQCSLSSLTLWRPVLPYGLSICAESG